MQLQLRKPLTDSQRALQELLKYENTVLSSSNSGGKDSVAMLDYLATQKYPCRFLSIHADLGLMEWPRTQDYIEGVCAERKIELVTVRAKKSLFRYILERMNRRKNEVFWPSPQSRYCTSYMKQIPVNKYLRRYQTVVNAVGIRKLESTPRAKKIPLKLNPNLCSKHYLDLSMEQAIAQHLDKPKGRLAIDWYPLFDWTLEQVWQQLGHTTAEWEERKAETDDAKAVDGWRFHYPYVIGNGNDRLSCCFCMMGTVNDLENAVAHNPIAWKFITNLERKSGFSYQPKRFLSDVQPAPSRRSWQKRLF